MRYKYRQYEDSDGWLMAVGLVLGALIFIGACNYNNRHYAYAEQVAKTCDGKIVRTGGRYTYDYLVVCADGKIKAGQ